MNPALGLTASMPSNATTADTGRFSGFCRGAVTFTVIVIVCAVVGLLPFFKLPPRAAMVQTMLFTAWLFKLAGAGAAQATGSVAALLDTAVTPPIVSRAGSEMVKLRLFASVEVVLLAVKVWVVEVPAFIDGLAELAVTATVTLVPVPPCGGAPGVAVFTTCVVPRAVPVPSAAVTVLVTEFDTICTMKFTFTDVPATSVPMLQLTLVAPGAGEVHVP